MLSFKDIQIIETSLEKVDSRDISVNKVYNSLTDLLTSRFYNELKNRLSKMFVEEPIESIRIKCSQQKTFFESRSDFIKLKNNDLSLYLTQQNLGSLSDYIWKSQAVERLDDRLYRSDIFVGQKFSSMIYKSFYRASKPLVDPGDYRVNQSYKEAVYRLQSEKISFFIEIVFKHFNLRIYGDCLLCDDFLNYSSESVKFDLALISS